MDYLTTHLVYQGFGGPQGEIPRPKIPRINNRKVYMGVNPKIGVDFSPKMDGENNGKPYEQMDDLGEKTHIFGNTHI